jgi:hypothetical protein
MDLHGGGRGYFKVLCEHSSGGSEENYENMNYIDTAGEMVLVLNTVCRHT